MWNLCRSYDCFMSRCWLPFITASRRIHRWIGVLLLLLLLTWNKLHKSSSDRHHIWAVGKRYCRSTEWASLRYRYVKFSFKWTIRRRIRNEMFNIAYFLTALPYNDRSWTFTRMRASRGRRRRCNGHIMIFHCFEIFLFELLFSPNMIWIFNGLACVLCLVRDSSHLSAISHLSHSNSHMRVAITLHIQMRYV